MGDCCSGEHVEQSYGDILQELTSVSANVASYVKSSWADFQGYEQSELFLNRKHICELNFLELFVNLFSLPS